MNNCVSQTANRTTDPLGGHEIWEVVVIVVITGPLSLVTIVGNLLVVISFRVNVQLRTVSNYFLLSLAVADLILGAVSMNLYAVYIIMGRWALGSLACDIWLAVDYVASNASVMNLLVISFDRFYSVTRPLTYRAKRTARRAAAAIALAWAVSFVLWGPAILFWPHVAGRPSGGERDDCSIPFLDEAALTFGTAIAAFYLPVTIMVVLYWKIYWEIESRSQSLEGLLGSVSSRGGLASSQGGPGERYVYSNSARSAGGSGDVPAGRGPRGDESEDREREEAEASRGRSVAAFSLAPTAGSFEEGSRTAGEEEEEEVEEGATVSLSLEENEPERKQQRRRPSGAPSGPPVATPPLGDTPGGGTGGARRAPSPEAAAAAGPGRGWRSSLRGSTSSESRRHKLAPKARRRRNMIIREKKAARTLSAILLAFILTWTPYNIMVLASISYCVPEKLWQLGYWLCYINSTVNPVCYALCNEHFRVTFKTLLLCRPGQRDWARTQATQASFRMRDAGSTGV